MIIVDPVTLGDVACSRPSSKYVWDRNGKLVQVPADTLAVTYDPADLTKAPYPLVDVNPVTNYATWSQDFTNSVWSKSGLTVTPDAAVAPDGSTTADKLLPTSTSGPHALSRQYPVAAGQPYTWSRFVKAGEHQALYVRFSDALRYEGGYSQVDVAALAQSVHSGNVVAAFLYDVSTDSDDGAWINRCAHTSWEIEQLCAGRWLGAVAQPWAANVAAMGAVNGDYFQLDDGGTRKFYQITDLAKGQAPEVFRGNKRKFPARALIVAEALRVVIYDMTQPGCPMWMVFDCSLPASWPATKMLWRGDAKTSVFALNGVLYVTNNANCILATAEFITDTGYFYGTSGGTTGNFKGNISQRNQSLGSDGSKVRPFLVNSVGNDVAVTVLSDAPIDPAAGMPVPTVALATGGGVGIIQNNGAVVSSASTAAYSHVSFSKGGDLIADQGPNASALSIARNVGGLTAGFALTALYGVTQVPSAWPVSVGVNALVPMPNTVIGRGGPQGLAFVRENPATPAKSMVANITNAYNTGWQVGDSRLAALADTVAETVAASGELVTNGKFDTDTSGWTAANGATLAAVSGELQITANGTSAPSAQQIISGLTVGRTYMLTASARRGTGANAAISITGVGSASTTNATATPLSITLTATTTSYIINAQISGATANGDTAYFDNISVKLAEPDRSVKNRGLIVNGSLTKAPVAPGAQMMGYRGFSATNYLEQPYNSDLDFGTGDFCVMGWAAVGNTTSNPTQTIVQRKRADQTGPTYRLRTTGNDWGFTVGDGTNQVQAIAANSAIAGAFAFFVAFKRGTTVELWLNGVLAASATNASLGAVNFDNTVPMRLGVNSQAAPAEWFGGSLALVRMGAAAPSADQIAQIYRDELALFQPGAQCTVDGSSTAVTALAYDDTTDLLHVGTSWGRSAFRGLVRAESEATTVGSITRLAAGGGAVVTAGTSAARAVQPAGSVAISNVSDRGAVFDLSTGQVVVSDAGKGIAATIEPAGGGYYRLGLSAVASSTGNGTITSFVAQEAGQYTSQTPTFSGDGASGLFVWQEDFVDGAKTSSLIPTAGTAVTRAADVISPGAGLVYSNVPITEPPYNAGTTYAKDALVYDPVSHNVFQSVAGGNVGKALDDKLSWTPRGATNRWAMLDQYNNTQTANPDEILMVASPQAISQGLYLGNLYADEVRISVVDQVEGLVYSETSTLIESNSGSSFFNWCFKRIKRKDYFLTLKMPVYANALVTISLRKIGGVAKCGMCAIGPIDEFGPTLMGLSTEGKDYSSTTFNFDGTSSTVIRPYAKRMACDVMVDNDQIDYLQARLFEIRQKPIVWVGGPYGSTAVYGRYESFKNVIQYATRSLMNLTIGGAV